MGRANSLIMSLPRGRTAISPNPVYAYSGCLVLLPLGKTRSLFGERTKQCRRPQRRIGRRIGGESIQSLDDRLQPDLVGMEHRAARPARPAIAVYPDEIDVGRAIGDSFFE